MVSDFISTLGNTNYVVPNGFVYFRMQMNIGSIDVDRKQHSKLGYWSWVIGSIIYWPHTYIRSSLKNVDVSSLKSDEYIWPFGPFGLGWCVSVLSCVDMRYWKFYSEMCQLSCHSTCPYECIFSLKQCLLASIVMAYKYLPF